MRKTLLLLLCVLVACAPVDEPEVVEQPEVVEPVKELPPVVQQDAFEAPTRTVKQSDGTSYGLTEDNRLVRVERPNETWEIKYRNNMPVEMVGPETIEFFYERGQLASIDLGATKLLFKYSQGGLLNEVSGGRETLHFDFDSKKRLREVKRGVAGATSMDYNDNGSIVLLKRGNIPTTLSYDDRSRLRKFDTGETHFITGFWRDDKLSSLTGKMFGQGLSVSYGPDYPPFEAKVLTEDGEVTFSSAYTETLYKVVDEYVYCNHVRRYPSVMFEGVSFALFHNYFSPDIVDYLTMQLRCAPYEA